MQFKVTYIRRRPGGGTNRRESVAEAFELRIGRGTDCELRLEDPRIRLHQATVREEGDQLRIESVGETELKIEGRGTRSARIAVGDVVDIGPYRLTVVEPSRGHRIALDVEWVRPPGNDLTELRRRSGLDLESTRLSMRTLSWLAILTTATVLLLLPGIDALTPFESGARIRPAQVWSAGELSDSHKILAGDCRACHRTAFRAVGDDACLECHPDVQRHAAPRFALGPPADGRCASCHPEHGGPRTPTLTAQRLCAGCHARPEEIRPATRLASASDFGTSHPAFGPGTATAQLKFSHVGHLRPDGLLRHDGRTVLTCRDCHVPDQGGTGMLAVNMERHCRRCHELRFDPDRPERTLPHGDSARALAALRDHYAAVALNEGFEPMPGASPSRRLPGRPKKPGTHPDPAARAWAKAMGEERARVAFSLAHCGECHVTLTPESSASGDWEVLAVTSPRPQMSAARFSHRPHRAGDCVDCHAVTETLNAPMLPTLERCRECHGGEYAKRRVPSTCTDCHDFHHHDQRLWAATVGDAALSGDGK